MGATILQSLPRLGTGLLLFESFEASTFMADQGWSLLNGTPQISSDVAKEGLKSLKLDTSYPQIEKTFPSPYFTYSAGYFYDDAATVAGGFTPFMNWISLLPSTYGLGVDLATSAGFYSKTVAGVTTATAVARTTGWHRFEMIHGPTLVLKIDGVSVSSTAFASSMTKVRVGCSVYAGAPAFGYFDWIQVCSSINVAVSNVLSGQTMKVFTAAGVLVGSAPDGLPVDTTSQDSPFNGYITVSRPGHTNPYFQSPPISISTGDKYRLCVYSFGRRPSGLDIKENAVRDDKESNTGINQSVFYFSRDMMTMTFTDLTEDQKEELYSWWQWAKRGEIYSVALDEGATYYSTLTAATIPNGNTATVASVDGITQGNALSIKDSTGQAREIKKVSSVAGLVITFNSLFCALFASGSQVRDQFYWPFVISTDKSLQLSLTNLRRKRWTATITFKEALL